MDASGRRHTRRRQPHSGAAANVSERRRADAVADARRRFRRHGARELLVARRLDGIDAQPGSLHHAVAEHRDSHDPVPCGDGRADRGHSRRRSRAARSRRTHRVPQDADHARRRGREEHPGDRTPRAGRRRRGRDVPEGLCRPRVHGLGESGAAAGAAPRRDACHPGAERRDHDANRRHRARLLGSSNTGTTTA